jgi:hypothetical protein
MALRDVSHEEGMDAMENRRERGFPTAPTPVISLRGGQKNTERRPEQSDAD